ncbi:MAG: preprotein translocase subunit SecE [Parcubacteria group bacterium ADurb.Bin159]|jgi:preprotein translocase subunit SecE|nr:MAG: preprotein translocase subunit SecE [Parcubacteria group bacterium ADurb.Bin159]
MFKKLIDYFKASKEEIKRVVWPTKKKATKDAAIVIIASLGLALFLGLLDFILTKIFQIMIS